MLSRQEINQSQIGKTEVIFDKAHPILVENPVKGEFESLISPETRMAAGLIVHLGDELRENFWRKGEGVLKTEEKESHHSLVTGADKYSQRVLISAFENMYPECVIIAEETEEGKEPETDEQRREKVSKALAEGKRIITIDPLDGTSHFKEGLPDWSISAAVIEDGEVVAGITYVPAHITAENHGKLYIAERGKGAYLNGEKLHGSKKTNLK